MQTSFYTIIIALFTALCIAVYSACRSRKLVKESIEFLDEANKQLDEGQRGLENLMKELNDIKSYLDPFVNLIEKYQIIAATLDNLYNSLQVKPELRQETKIPGIYPKK